MTNPESTKKIPTDSTACVVMSGQPVEKCDCVTWPTATITEAPKRTMSRSSDEDAGSLRTISLELVSGMANSLRYNFLVNRLHGPAPQQLLGTFDEDAVRAHREAFRFQHHHELTALFEIDHQLARSGRLLDHGVQ